MPRYEATSKDIGKWTPLVRVNREAPTLVFADSRKQVPQASSTAALTSSFAPESAMEAEVAALLKAAGVQSERRVEETEEALALKVCMTISIDHSCGPLKHAAYWAISLSDFNSCHRP